MLSEALLEARHSANVSCRLPQHPNLQNEAAKRSYERLLQLRCATCNKVQEPTSRDLTDLFVLTHWFHSGYSLLVDIADPQELSGMVVGVDIAKDDKED